MKKHHNSQAYLERPKVLVPCCWSKRLSVNVDVPLPAQLNLFSLDGDHAAANDLRAVAKGNIRDWGSRGHRLQKGFRELPKWIAKHKNSVTKKKMLTHLK
jgi:hypothetical protein